MEEKKEGMQWLELTVAAARVKHGPPCGGSRGTEAGEISGTEKGLHRQFGVMCRVYEDSTVVIMAVLWG